MEMTYDVLIQGINNGSISKVVFAVKGYAHYRNCVIERKTEYMFGVEVFNPLVIQLSSKHQDQVAFFQDFHEDTKLFRMGRKGSFTLRQMWDRIEILSVEYNE